MTSQALSSKVPIKFDLAKLIDHTILKPDASGTDIRRLCAEAKQYGFATAFVNPTWIAFAAELLKGSGVKVGVAIGFPLGATTTETKVFETQQAIVRGAQEPDMVINVGWVKSGLWHLVKEDIAAVVRAAREAGEAARHLGYDSGLAAGPGHVPVKVILETCLLTDEEKVRAALLAQEAGAAFVKTSTGFSTGGATVADVKLLRKTVGEQMGVKAAGGIRDYATAKALIDAGANRIGTSAGPKIMKDYLAALKQPGK